MEKRIDRCPTNSILSIKVGNRVRNEFKEKEKGARF